MKIVLNRNNVEVKCSILADNVDAKLLSENKDKLVYQTTDDNRIQVLADNQVILQSDEREDALMLVSSLNSEEVDFYPYVAGYALLRWPTGAMAVALLSDQYAVEALAEVLDEITLTRTANLQIKGSIADVDVFLSGEYKNEARLDNVIYQLSHTDLDAIEIDQMATNRASKTAILNFGDYRIEGQWNMPVVPYKHVLGTLEPTIGNGIISLEGSGMGIVFKADVRCEPDAWTALQENWPNVKMYDKQYVKICKRWNQEQQVDEFYAMLVAGGNYEPLHISQTYFDYEQAWADANNLTGITGKKEILGYVGSDNCVTIWPKGCRPWKSEQFESDTAAYTSLNRATNGELSGIDIRDCTDEYIPKRYCQWTSEVMHGGTICKTDCGNKITKTAATQSFAHCPYCGKAIM